LIAATNLWQHRAVIGHLAQRELKLRYKRSLLGWLWSLINPAAILGVYTVVFGTFLSIEPPVAGNGHLKSFAIYLFTALVCWNFFSWVLTGSMGWLLSSGPLLNKVYLPPEAPIWAGALSVLVQTGTEVAILLGVLAVLGNLSTTALYLPFVMVSLFFFSLGLGFITSLINVYFRDVTHLVDIGITVLFYATPIVYPFELVPKYIFGGFPIREVVGLNPLTQFVGITREILYSLETPSLERLGALALASFATFALGWTVFRRFGGRLSEEL
jgi:ABC-type polysaccharide/polyol phosphate export permease